MTIPPGSGGTTRADMARDTMRPRVFGDEAAPLGEIELVPQFAPIQRTHVLPAKLIADAFGLPIRMLGMTYYHRPPPRLIRTPSAPAVIAALREAGWRVSVQHLRLVRDLETRETMAATMAVWHGSFRDSMRLVSRYETDGRGTVMAIGSTTAPRYELNQRGGVTSVTLWREDTPGVAHIGEAHCHPNDNFCKSDGLILALERALEDAGLKWRA